jgi:tight adherence protein B
MTEAAVFVVLIAAIVITTLMWRNIRLRRAVRQRLGDIAQDASSPTAEVAASLGQPFVVARPWLAYLGGVLLGLGLYFAGLPASFAFAFGLIAGLLGAQLEQFRVARTTAQMETQLADALDLMMSALTAGTGVSQALEVASQEVQAPLRPQLEQVVNRIRYGDDPQSVLRTLEAHVPLTSMRLFTAALAVHWEVGGSLTGPLAVVARTIRDRTELGRRVRSLTMQSRASVLAVMMTTYFIALVMWRTDPDRMAAFLSTTLGQQAFAAALILQALGIVWSSRLSRLPM